MALLDMKKVILQVLVMVMKVVHGSTYLGSDTFLVVIFLTCHNVVFLFTMIKHERKDNTPVECCDGAPGQFYRSPTVGANSTH